MRASENELRDFFRKYAHPTSANVTEYTWELFEKAKLMNIDTTIGSLRRHFALWKQYGR